MPTECVIYALFDPSSPDHIRYVGKTVMGVDRRLFHHIKDSSKQQKTHKRDWIRSLLKQGREPGIREIEKVVSQDRRVHDERERYWISSLKNAGHKLTNGTEGGDGGKQFPEVIERIRKKLTGRKASEETKKKNSDHARALWQTESHRANMRDKPPAHAMPHTEETKNLLRERILERWNDAEYRQKHSEAVKKALESEDIRAKMKHGSSMRGRHHSEETKRKMSESQKGRTISQEQREKLSQSLKGRQAWNKGKSFSAESMAKMSDSQKKKILSPEARANISEAVRKRWEPGGDLRRKSEERMSND